MQFSLLFDSKSFFILYIQCLIFVMCLISANKSKVYYGLLKEPDLNIPLDDEDDPNEGEEKPKVSLHSQPVHELCRW